MNLHITTLPGTHTLCLTGDLDLYNVEAGREAFLECLADKPGIDLDLSGLENCDTAGMQLLLAARQSAVVSAKAFSIQSTATVLEKCAGLLGLSRETWASHLP